MEEHNIKFSRFKNDDIVFEDLFKTYYSPLCNYAFKIVGNYEVTEDLVQNLFIQLYEKKAFITISKPEQFLIKSIKYKCIDYLRKANTFKKVPFDDIVVQISQTPAQLSEEDIEPLLHYFASKLPDKTRTVFLLSRQKGMTNKEIAIKENISIKTVEAQMGRALRQLKVLLKSENLLFILLLLKKF